MTAKLPPGARARGERIRAQREQARASKAKVADDTKAFVDRAVAAKIPMRDIAYLLGISYQRVSQIAKP